jgi:hypothetical protein
VSRVLAVACALALLAPSVLAAEADAVSEKPGAGAKPPRSVAWVLRLPQETNVTYQGVVSFDQAGVGTASMLYPAPNAAGFIAALITHGFLLESTRTQQLEKIRQVADQVLLPYQPVLNSFQSRELMQRGLDRTSAAGPKRLAEFSEKPGAEIFVESIPLFSMTQDHTTIVLDNAIVIHAPHGPASSPYKNVLRIISRPQTRADLVTYWTANDGENLKAESVSLLAESLDLALRELSGELDKKTNPHRTVRYREGTAEKMERGQIVSENCDRVVLKNLRGWLMSVPPSRGADGGTSCDASPRTVGEAK